MYSTLEYIFRNYLTYLAGLVGNFRNPICERVAQSVEASVLFACRRRVGVQDPWFESESWQGIFFFFRLLFPHFEMVEITFQPS